MSSHVEQIKEKLGIAEVVGSYIQIEKAGANYKAKCPFHNEKTPSFFISPVRNSYYCFGCGAKGDIISFVQEFEGLDFIGALRVLAKRAGVELKRENPTVRTERERMYLAMEYATIYFERQLQNNTSASEYLNKRGLKSETIKEWRLGYAPNDWNALSNFLLSKNITLQEMEKVGLNKKSEKRAGEYYDRFRGRIMFPIFDGSGRVVAFSGRQFENDGTEAKYLNSPETSLFEKSKILYGYDKAKLEIRKSGFSVLVEGQMDLLLSHQSGFKNTVATSGTALTQEHLTILHRLAERLVIAYDGDSAGNSASTRGWALALSAGLDVRIAVLPDGKDPADLCQENPKVFEDCIKEAKHIVEVEINKVNIEIKDGREKALAIEKRILPYVAALGSMAEMSHFISSIAHIGKMKEDVVWNIVNNLKNKIQIPNSNLPEVSKKRSVTRIEGLSRLVFGIIFWLEKQNKNLDIKEKACSIIGSEVFQRYEQELQSFKDELIFEAEVSNYDTNEIEKRIEELSFGIREECAREELMTVMHKLKDAESQKDGVESERLIKLSKTLSDEIEQLKKKTNF